MNEEKNDPEEGTKTPPWGNRAIKEKTWGKLVSGIDAIWSSRVMILITIILINGIFLGSTLMAGVGWTIAGGHIVVILLVIRCLVLMFSAKANTIDTYLTYQPKR